MSPFWVLAETLRSITNIKLKELSEQRANFEENKTYLLFAADAESEPSKKVRTLLDGCKGLSVQQKGMKPNTFYDDIAQLLEQAKYDPSISGALLEQETQLRRELDVRSLRYEYASLYSQLLTEWLADNNQKVERSRTMESTFKERIAHRKEWESYVFKALLTNQEGITSYLELLFSSTKETRASLEVLRKGIREFEETLTLSDQVNQEEMHWCGERSLAQRSFERPEKGSAHGHVKSQGFFGRAWGYPQHATFVHRPMGLAKTRHRCRTTKTDR